jgi:hypothetical protein
MLTPSPKTKAAPKDRPYSPHPKVAQHSFFYFFSPLPLGRLWPMQSASRQKLGGAQTQARLERGVMGEMGLRG